MSAGKNLAASLALISALGVGAGLTAAPVPAFAEPAASDRTEGEVLMQADELSYDQNTNVVTASGNVEVAYGERIMTADTMTYNETTGVVTAEGNVVLMEPTGEVLFADSVELTDELKNGVVRTLRVLLTDNSRLAGNEAQRRADNVTTLYKGVYSPCDVCEDGESAPLWQIRAFRVIHNEAEQRIIYEDAFFEMFGIPIAYVPFFSHPDPTVERQSGFLAPSFGNSSDLGTRVTIPYYLVIQDNMDFLFKPTYTSKQGMLYQGQFRHRTSTGQYAVNLAATWPRKPTPGTPAEENFRGSLFSDGHFQLNNEWSWGFNTELTTDDTFLRRYGIDGQTDLTTTAFVQSEDGPNLFTAEAFYFQGLLASDNPRTTPIIAPLINYSYEHPTKLFGGTGTMDVNAMVLNRNSGADSRRLSVDLGWDREHVLTSGEIYRLFGSLRGDIYHTDNVLLENGTLSTPQTIARGLPTLGAEWRWPLVRGTGSTRQIVEPIVQMIYAPNSSVRDDIPDEDSLSFEFDTTNLFGTDRFAGLDRWESGARANLGVRFSIQGDDGGNASLLVGQTLRLRENSTFSAASGLQDEKSDYVGRLSLSPSDNFRLDHRFRLDQDDLTIRRNEVDLSATWGPLNTTVGYAFLDQSLSAALGDREEITGTASYQFADYWSVRGSTRRDIQASQTISNNIGLYYGDECFNIGLAYDQQFTRDQDIEPTNTIMLTIMFKHLGGTQFGSTVGGSQQ